MLVINNLSYTAGGRRILDNIEFCAESGSLTAVIGPNGAGKSTLLKLIAGLLKPRSGSILADGGDITRLNCGERAKRVAYLPQTTQPVPSTVYNAVLLGCRPRMGWYPSDADHESTEAVLDYSGLSCHMSKCVTQLSGGEFQKVLIARTLVQDAPVLLMDEPVNHLDLKNRFEIMEMTAEITVRKNLASIIVMHDLNLALRYADNLLVIDGGQQKTFCKAHEADGNLLSQVYQIPVDVSTRNGRPAVMY